MSGEVAKILSTLYEDTLGLTFQAKDLMYIYTPYTTRSAVHRFLLLKQAHEGGRLIGPRVNTALDFLYTVQDPVDYRLVALTERGSIDTLWQVEEIIPF